MLSQAHIYIRGEVIGVGFRAWTKIQAKEVGIKGWVRNAYNRPDIFGSGGGVEACVQGEHMKVDEMLLRLQAGSPVARVDDVEIIWQEPKEIFEGFEIKK